MDKETSVPREARVKAELYRIFKDAINEGIVPESVSLVETENSYSVVDVEPELRVAKGKIADLVVTVKPPYGREEALLVLEVKKRTFRVSTYLSGAKQASQYAEGLGAWFFAVCDGWFMLLFRSVVNELVGAYGVEMSKDYAQNILAVLIEYRRRERSECLSQLPRAPDPGFLREKLFPALTRGGISVRATLLPREISAAK